MAPDSEHLAFRELLKLAESDPVLAAATERLMREGAPLAEVLGLRPVRHRRRHMQTSLTDALERG